MKLKLVFIIALSSISLISNSQRLGAKMGISFATAHVEQNNFELHSSALFGISGGIIGELQISEQLAIKPGLLFFRKGTIVNVSGRERRLPIYSIEVPFNIQFKSNMNTINIFAEAGPYLGIGLLANSIDEDDTFEVYFGSYDDELKQIDLGVNFGAGIEIKNTQLGIYYSIGMTNLSNDPDEIIKNGVLSISATFFSGQK